VKYFLGRDGQSFGPYTIDELRRYQTENRLGPNDVLRREDGQNWEPWQQVLNAPAAPTPAAQPQYHQPQAPAWGGMAPQQPQQAAYGGFSQPPQGAGAVGPMPPDMQWYIVFLITMVCSIFGLYWIFRQVSFVQTIDPQCKAKRNYILGLILAIGGYAFAALLLIVASTNSHLEEAAYAAPLGFLAALAGVVFLIMGHFQMRKSIHTYYTTVEPMGIDLMTTEGAILTFFFNMYYFQYHFANIAARKKAMGHQ
jgi:GYF domain 2